MSFLLPCPNCGPRDASEFRYGGQILPPVSDRSNTTVDRATISNLPGQQRERWYHRLGCRRWLVADRDVCTNRVLATSWLDGNAT